MKAQTVSVIIPAYNQGDYLAEAIESVLTQTYPHFEIVVVDDGSTDNTAEVAQSYSDPRVRYIYRENGGLSAARNTGLEHASGELITFLDSDDLFLPEKLSVLITAMDNNPAVGLAAGQAIMIDDQSRRLDKMIDSPLPENQAQLLLGNPIHVGSVVVKREWLAQVEPFDESFRACEDWDMWIRLAKAGCQMCWLPVPVSLYRVHAAQMTRGAERMRTAMLATLDKTFSDSHLPGEWYALKNTAYAAVYVRAAARAFHANELINGKSDLDKAIQLDPTLLDNHADKLSTQLAGWADAPMVSDSLAYLERVFDNLPDSLAVLRQKKRHYLGQMAMQKAFEHYRQGDLAAARFFVRRAFRYQPGWIKNRGALSIFARSHFSPS
ncbi:MAG: glycosyltransferase [Anaerolineae bacterium]|nr:glycosyltransferase [Anaerolineae bacterium]